MGLFSRNPNGGIMDVIRCDEPSYLVWKWHPENSEEGKSRRENTIRWGSSLRVREGSVAVFIYSGNCESVQDFIEGPADMILNTKNLPVLSSFLGLAYNGGSPFQAEVYFINLAQTVQSKFAVPYFDVFDPDLKEFSVPVAVRGTLEYNIGDYRHFIKVHRLDRFSPADLQLQVKDAVIETVKDIVLNMPEDENVPVIQLERKISAVKAAVLERLQDKMYRDYGIELTDVSIAALEIDKESDGYHELLSVTRDLTADTRKVENRAKNRDIAGNQVVGLFSRAASAFVDIKENQFIRRKQAQTDYAEAVETQLAGRVGAAGAKIINALGRKNGSENGSASVPPPLPVSTYYVALNGQQSGPFDFTLLKQMAASGTLQADTLVWCDGMKDWQEAGKVKKLSSLFEL